MVEHREELMVAYSKDANVTTVFNVTFAGKKKVSQEAIGWYSGKPAGYATEAVKEGLLGLRAEFFCEGA